MATPEYIVYPSEKQDDTIVGFFYAQEADLHSHRLSQARYVVMLESLPEGRFRTRIEGLAVEVAERIAEVESIIEATRPQLPERVRLEASKQRLASKM